LHLGGCNNPIRRRPSTWIIEKAEAAVIAAKAKYDKALDEMEKLVTKRKQQDDKKVLDAYHAGNKSAEEIIAFIQSKKTK